MLFDDEFVKDSAVWNLRTTAVDENRIELKNIEKQKYPY